MIDHSGTRLADTARSSSSSDTAGGALSLTGADGIGDGNGHPPGTLLSMAFAARSRTALGAPDAAALRTTGFDRAANEAGASRVGVSDGYAKDCPAFQSGLDGSAIELAFGGNLAGPSASSFPVTEGHVFHVEHGCLWKPEQARAQGCADPIPARPGSDEPARRTATNP